MDKDVLVWLMVDYVKDNGVLMDNDSMYRRLKGGGVVDDVELSWCMEWYVLFSERILKRGFKRIVVGLMASGYSDLAISRVVPFSRQSIYNWRGKIDVNDVWRGLSDYKDSAIIRGIMSRDDGGENEIKEYLRKLAGEWGVMYIPCEYLTIPIKRWGKKIIKRGWDNPLVEKDSYKLVRVYEEGAKKYGVYTWVHWNV